MNLDFPSLQSTEDQQAIEDEGIIIPMKPTPHSSNAYARHQANFFQPQQQPSFARSPLPMFTTNVTNNPIAMMNYFNASALQQQAIQNEPEVQHYGNHNQTTKQTIPIDIVSFF